MSKLIDLLPEGKLSQNPSPLLENIQSPGHQSQQLNHTKLSTEIASKNDQVTSSLTPVQQQHLDSLIARFIQRTQESKRLTQAYRSCHANSRAISGFLPSIKEMIYPIHGQRGVGARLWDVDGNEYVDISMGFGTLLFGHSPSFIVEAVQEQMAQGILHGPQSRLSGQVAELICFLTGAERAAFCNDGTEAVMGAIRLARTVTGRSKIALFAGSYHGNFDGVLVKGITGDDGKLRSIPAAAGIPSYIVEDAIALDYGSSESLDVIKAHAHELAAILVEPIQSSRPDWQPKEFLHELRELTKKTGIVLIFDEVITGFRMHPGGIQGLWDIQADITTYGKAVAAGLPIGVIAGKAQFLDALDGGFWNYGDESYPQAETTFFAGTFFKHPLAMSAAYAALNHIKNTSPQLQEKLNQRTTQLVETLNSYFEQTQVPITVVNFGSLFRFNCQTKLSNLFFYHLLEKGVYVWEGRTFYLSTAHTDADIEKIISAVKQSVVEMQAGEFLPSIHISTKNLSSANAYSNQNSKYARKIPLTEAQKQLWFVAQMGDNASRAYNQSITSHLRGFFNLEAMNRAVQKIVNRHEALRVTFSPEGDYQKIPANLLINIPFIDFSTLEYNERQEKISEMLTTEAQQIFDLEQGPLLRLHIVKLESQHHLLIFTIHHIIADGWSINILLRELSTIYFAECQNVAYKLPKPMQLSDYAQWEASLQQSPAMAKAEAYWLKQFAGTVPVLELPTTRSRLAVNTYQGSRQKIKIDTALYADLKRLSGQCNCTLLTTLLAGFIVLIHRLSSQQDIVVGIVSAGQSAFKDGYLVGHCVNLLPIRTQVIGDAKFTEYLNTVKQVLLDAYEHQIYPFIKLIENLNLPRDLSRSPLVTAVFNLEKASLQSQSFGEEFTVNQNHTHTSQFDISWDITQTDNELFVECEYNNDLFDRQTIQRWLGHYVTLLEGMVARPEQYLWELPLLKEAEKLQLLVEWNNTQADYPKEQSIHQLFENQVEHTPDAIAVVFKEQQLTYRELNNQANQLAHYLQTLGVKPEVVVGVCVDRSLEMVIGLLGILKAGGAYLPLDPAYPQERLNFMLCDAQVSVLLTQEKLVTQLPEYGARVVKLDTDWGLIAQESEINLVSKITDHNLAFVIYTSGSTGTPKGVAIAHYSLLNLYQAWKNAYQSRTLVTSYLQTASFSFDVFSGDWIHALCCGAKLVLCPSAWLLNPAKLYELMLQEKVDCADFVPAIIRNLMRYLEETQQNINFMRLLVVGSDSFYVQEYEEFRRFCSPKTRLINSYGVSESTVDSLYFESSEINLPLDSLVPIGKPFANISIYILDDHLQPVPIGVTGELYIGGYGLARCYFNNPKLTAEKFIPNPFHDLKLENRYENFANPKLNRLYKTGDLARYLNDGNIEFLGRSDRQVKIRGFRIELGEIEALLIQHPEVKESVVISREDDPGNKRLVAYIVPPPKTTPSISNLRQFLQQKLPDYMIPTAFVLQKELPLTPNGKIDRQNLPAPDTNRPKLQENFLAPRDILELQLVQIWEGLLNVSPIGITDNFFDLGGHSLLAARLMAQIHKQLGQNLLISTLFQGATIEHLASILRQSANCVRSSPLVAIQPHGSKPPLFFVHPIGGNVLCYYELARNLQPDQPFYGLQSLGLDGESQPHTSIEDMATDYITALRVVQPQGPYFLGGWSMGGVVAFEMAQQLHKQGHKVKRLVLLDSLAPVESNKTTEIYEYDDSKLLANFAEDMAGLTGKNLSVFDDDLQQLDINEQLNHFLEQAKITNFLPPDIGKQQLHYLVQVFKSNIQAMLNYVPQVYPHRIILFRSSSIGELNNPTLGWDELSSQPVEIISAPGEHYTMLSLPHVQLLKEQLKLYLD
uniref:non-ribosomal peptide synthetase n=1 Tax=unclassified Calothrix TaxID=2619626 RepID=UPI002795C655|nr:MULTISPECIES: non-ribosomal peptide synthetase [unclassified Calothrix]